MRPSFLLSLSLAAAALAGTAAPAEVTRMKGAPGALILTGVKIPANAEMVILSGQLASPIDPAKAANPATLTMADFGDSKTQTISCLTKIKALLEAQGYKMSDVVKMTLFIAADPKLGRMDFNGVNDGFKMFFNTADNPNTTARSAIQVAALAGPNFLIEIEAIAAK